MSCRAISITAQRACALTCSLALLIAARDARAQARDAEADAADEAIVRTSASASGEVVEDARLASGFVSRVTLEEAADEALVDALERAPGVHARRVSSSGQEAQVQVRGGTPRQLMVLINGVRVRVPEGLGFDVGSLAAGPFASAQVYRGVAGVIYGAGALTGAIDLRTRAADEAPWRVWGLASASSFGGRALGSAASLSGERLSARLEVGARAARGDFPFIDQQGERHLRVNNDHARRYAAATIQAGAPQARRGALEAALLWDQGERGVSGPSEFQERFSAARLEDQRMISTASWRKRDAWSSARSALDLEANAGAQWRRGRYHNHVSLLGGEGFESVSDAWSVEAAMSASLYRGAHFGRASAQARYESFSSQGQGQAGGDVQATRRTIAAALSDEWALVPQRLSLIGALRAELLDDGRATQRPLMPALGALVELAPWAQLRANAARTFRAPDFDELYLETELVRGDPTLRPETAWGGDAGVVLGRARGAWSLEAVVFWQRQQALILFVPISAYTQQARNMGDGESRGVEARATLRPARRLRLESGYTLTDAFLREAGRPPRPYQPRHQARALVRWDLTGAPWAGALPGLALEAGATWRGAITLDTFGRLENPGWLSVDASARVSPWPWLTARASLHNLLDEQRALDSLQRPLPGRAFSFSLALTGVSSTTQEIASCDAMTSTTCIANAR